VSTGLIYQYFGDKDDVLLLSLKLVLETYEKEIPPRLEGLKHPVERLCMALWAYCTIVDGLREATVLAYRSTKSLRADRRALVKQDELRTNRLLHDCLRACIAGGYMRTLNEYLLVYQYVTFCHGLGAEKLGLAHPLQPGTNTWLKASVCWSSLPHRERPQGARRDAAAHGQFHAQAVQAKPAARARAAAARKKVQEPAAK